MGANSGIYTLKGARMVGTEGAVLSLASNTDPLTVLKRNARRYVRPERLVRPATGAERAGLFRLLDFDSWPEVNAIFQASKIQPKGDLMLADIKDAIRRSSLWRNFGGPIRDQHAVNGWVAAGRPTPVPHPVKVRNIMALADIFDINTLVETGTFKGIMVDACLRRFEEIHSIEIYEPLATAAKRRFAHFSHVHVHEGDSGEMLAEILPVLTGRTLFWLDGHYSGEGTGRGVEETPVLREIALIRQYRAKPNEDVIMVDDARCFTGDDGYPRLSDFIAQLTSDFGVSSHVADDAIILLPER